MQIVEQAARHDSLLLEGKRALIFAAGGSIGAAVAREFLVQGAEVFLSGRSKAKVEGLANDIGGNGNLVHAAEVDALDEAAVASYTDRVVRDAGGVDIVFNAIGPLPREYGGGRNALDLSVDEFMTPLRTVVQSSFITAMAAARHMKAQGSGVILFVTGSPGRPHTEGATAIGRHSRRSKTLHGILPSSSVLPASGLCACGSSAMPDTGTIQEVMRAMAAGMGISEDQASQFLASATMLHVSPTTADTAKMAAFLASYRARTVTGTVVMSEIR
jgi:NAD(P)-dependent dehydrogenase (short-subunit alcohol dehydrogenase family)